MTVTNQDGIKVPFGASDVKALLSMHEAYHFRTPKYGYPSRNFGFVGEKCKAEGKVPGEGDSRDANTNPPAPALANSTACRDVNAGAFHIVLANVIGIAGKGIVADIDRFNDVWNQPIPAFTAKIGADLPVGPEHQALGIVRRVKVDMKMYYGEELKFYTPELAAQGKKNFVSKLPVTGTPHQLTLNRDYAYILELNASGTIIGGEWITETRPDFISMYRRDKEFRDRPVPLAALKSIYRPLKR